MSLLDCTGVFLPKLCEAEGGNARRGMAEIRSSGVVAPGPLRSVKNLKINEAETPQSQPLNTMEFTAQQPVASPPYYY